MQPISSPCYEERLRLLAEDLLPPAETAWLEEHLQRCARCRETLDQLIGEDRLLDAVREYFASNPAEARESTAGGEPLDFLAPSDWPSSLGRLGTYEVIGVLGRGGMGVVVKAYDPALRRNVAIKVLSASLASCAAARRRFLREARAAAAVVHEHVVSVFAVVESAALPFFVMEYVPGRSLQDRLDRTGPLSLPEILRIGMQTAAGLAAAHAQGLVHRDVKPANILLENGVERVRLSDFGLARAAADAGVTQSGVVAGTPHYMAPEQARGETADSRADLFSLGSTMYTMCAGHPPFRAESPLAVLRRVCDDNPRPLREINPEVPAWLESIIARLHAKNPAWRYQSAAEVADVLGRCLAHVQQPLASSLPDEVLVPPRAMHSRRWPRLRWAVALAAISGVLSGALAFCTWRLRERGESSRGITRPAPGAPRASTLPEQSRSETEEITQQIASARARTRSMEADLHERDMWVDRDRVSALARDLSARALSLERGLASEHDIGSDNGTASKHGGASRCAAPGAKLDGPGLSPSPMKGNVQ
jgi:serine/threonine-protein kinase